MTRVMALSRSRRRLREPATREHRSQADRRGHPEQRLVAKSFDQNPPKHWGERDDGKHRVGQTGVRREYPMRRQRREVVVVAS